MLGKGESVVLLHGGSDSWTHWIRKFIEVRRQEGGLVIVTGKRLLSYPVPILPPTLYYVVDLFCWAMTMNMPRRSVSEVLMLVKSAHGV